MSEIDDRSNKDRSNEVPGAPGAGPKAFDMEALRARMQDDRLALELVRIFQSTVPALVDQIHAAVGRNDQVAAAKAAHRLKGAAAAIGAEGVQQAAGWIEALGQTGAQDGALALAALEQAFQELWPLLDGQ